MDKDMDQKHQETNYDVEAVRKVAGGQLDEEALEDRAVEDFTGHPVQEEEQETQVRADVTSTTDAPVSVLSQKHLFWFPSDTFQEQVRPASTEVISQATQRASGIQSEESKENESQEVYHHQSPIDADDDDHDHEDHDDHHDLDDHDNDDHDDHDDPDSHQEEVPQRHQVKHYIPAHDLVEQGRHEDHDDHDDHYDMGEHEEERGRAQYGSQEFDDNNAYDEHESYEDHEDVADDHDDGHPDESQENPDKDDHDDHGDSQEHFHHNDHNNSREHDHDSDRNDDQEHDDHDDHDDDHKHDDHDDQDDHDDSQEHIDHDDDYDDGQEHYDHADHEDSQEHHDHDRVDDDFNDQDDLDEPDHDDHDSYEHHDSREDLNGQQHNVIFSSARDKGQNRTEGVKATTDETWLDGYPVNAAESENGESTTERVGLDDRGMEIATSLPVSPESPVMGQWPSHVTTDDSSLEHTEAAPTRSWLPEVTKNTFADHSPPPPGRNRGSSLEEHIVHGLPGESGQREGEIGEAPCTGQNCPPVTPTTKGPKVAAIIVVVCLVAIAGLLGLWCYRRQQQKSSVYEMNGKGQSPARPNQQMEMQQKV